MGEAPPDDFSLTYDVREASLPPPHYFQYTLRLGPAGEGELLYQPDYDFNAPPVWRVPFHVSDGARTRLYEFLRSHGALSREWREGGGATVGGRTRTVEIVATGHRTRIPPDAAAVDVTLAGRIFDAIEALVDEETWQDVEERRSAFQASYRPSE